MNAPAPALRRAFELLAAGEADAAAEALSQLLARDPAFAEAHHLLAFVQLNRGRVGEAEASFREALRLKPTLFMAARQLGDLLAGSGRPAEAVEAYRTSMAVKEPDAPLLSNLGFALLALGRNDEARAVLEQAVARDARLAAAHGNLGLAFHASGEIDAAVRCYEQALQLDPEYSEACANLALALWRLGRREEAREYARRAQSARPLGAEAWKNLGHLQREFGDFDAACQCFRRAIAADPGHVMSHYGLAAELLSHGAWVEGWREYSWRATKLGRSWARDEDGLPRALPESLSGREIVLVGEQGPGDILFFLRFAPELARRGARLHFHGEPRLAAMLGRTGRFGRIAGPDAPVPPGALAIPVADLPYLLGAYAEGVRPPPFALAADPERVAAARQRLASLGPRPWIALTWRAGKRPAGEWRTRYFKWIDPDVLGKALRGLEATFVCVQRAPEAEELRALGAALGAASVDLGELNTDLEEMLALLAALDAYAGVSNTNMHLAAGLGRPAHVLVPHPPEWRWMRSGDESPWFPGFRLHREDPDRGWEEPLARLRAELGALRGD